MKKSISKITTGTRFKEEAVFVMFYAYHLGKCHSLMQMRWDGSSGFVGGMVDEDEELIEALVRETKEEIAFDVSDRDLVPFCSHLISKKDKNFATHLYTLEIEFDQFYSIIKNSVIAKDFMHENRGNFIITVDEDDEKRCKKLLKSYLAPTVKEELELIISSFGA